MNAILKFWDVPDQKLTAYFSISMAFHLGIKHEILGNVQRY
jgi:hypothetical protein